MCSTIEIICLDYIIGCSPKVLSATIRSQVIVIAIILSNLKNYLKFIKVSFVLSYFTLIVQVRVTVDPVSAKLNARSLHMSEASTYTAKNIHLLNGKELYSLCENSLTMFSRIGSANDGRRRISRSSNAELISLTLKFIVKQI